MLQSGRGHNQSSLDIVAGSEDNGYVAYYAKKVTKEESESDFFTEGDFKFYDDNGNYYLMGYTGTKTDLVLLGKVNGKNYAIHKSAFERKYDLTSVVISDAVTEIGIRSFSYCPKLTSVVIPSSVTKVGVSAFNCKNLTSLTCHNPVPLAISASTYSPFSAFAESCTLYVPQGSKAAYEAAEGWKEFENIVELGNEGEGGGNGGSTGNENNGNENTGNGENPDSGNEGNSGDERPIGVTDVVADEAGTEVVGIYSILGSELKAEPESGAFIVKFSNGTAKKFVK